MDPDSPDQKLTMSLQEVVDLSSLLSTEEHDQSQLENKILELDTSIDQQEIRVSMIFLTFLRKFI